MTAARKLATYEDLLALPEDAPAEVIGGELVALPGALPRHGYAQIGLGGLLRGPFDRGRGGGPGGWWILPEVDVRLGAHDIVRPDLAGWRRERLPSPWNTRPIDVVPDWIAEVLSPSCEKRDRVTKMRLYAHAGVPHYWLIDPAERCLEVYALEGARWVLAGSFDDTSVARIPPFEAIELPVGELFPPEEPPAGEA